jgi:hypothetical protein
MKTTLRSFIVAAIVSLAGLSAHAQTFKTPPLCSVTSCTGFYFGGALQGFGTNADILGNGISNSVFANGGGIGAQVGYQIWNGNFFAAFEAAGIYTVPAQGNPPVPVNPHFMGLQIVKLGTGLSNLITPAPSTGSQGPTGIFANMQASLISPYILAGVAEKSNVGTGWATGAGAEFTLGAGYNLFAEYIYVGYNASVAGAVVNQDQIVRLGVNRKF